MTMIDVIAGISVLAVTVGVGTVVHELSHALALRAFGVPYRIDWLPDRDGDGRLGGLVIGRLATVTPTQVTATAGPLRLAALMPLTLAVPFLFVAAGYLPDPFTRGPLAIQLAAIGWLACAIPSPDDFALVWHAKQVVGDREDTRAS